MRVLGWVVAMVLLTGCAWLGQGGVTGAAVLGEGDLKGEVEAFIANEFLHNQSLRILEVEREPVYRTLIEADGKNLTWYMTEDRVLFPRGVSLDCETVPIQHPTTRECRRICPEHFPLWEPRGFYKVALCL